MSRLLNFRRAILATTALLLLLGQGQASGQSGATLRVSQPNAEEFPLVSLYLSLTDSEGIHIPDLSSRNFIVLEEGEPIHGTTVEEQVIGTRQVYVMDTTHNMRGRDNLGLTRFDYVRRSLLDWWSMPNSSVVGVDDLSLLTEEGMLVAHSSMSAELAASLAAFEPDYRDEPARFDILLEAIDFVEKSPPQSGMQTHIILITSLILEPEEIPLTDTIARAKDNAIQIYPILVGPEELLDYPELENLRLLGEATGGELIFFDPDLGLTRLADRLLSQRSLYHLTYSSRANRSGSVQVQVQATEEGLDVLSDPRTFSIEVSSPDVAFLLPPEKIVRKSDDAAATTEMLSPSTASMEVLITFSDGHDRPIVSSQLIVDDLIVDENRTPPFETFEWDISEYFESETHILQVVVEDSLGLLGTSVTTPVEIEVIPPPGGLNTVEPLVGTIIPILGVLASVIIVSIIIGNMIRQRADRTPASATSSPAPRGVKQRVMLSGRKDGIQVEGYLQAETDGIEHIPLVGTDIVLGRDSSLSTVHLTDPSVSNLHARVTRLANGNYQIKDQGSIAGTWVNFEPISDKGHLLEHGDLIHIGRVIYRFTLNDPPPTKGIRVSVISTPKS